MFGIKTLSVLALAALFVQSNEKFNINVLSHHQYVCSTLSTKELESETKEKKLDVSITCHSHFNAKDININLSYTIDHQLDRTHDTFLTHLFYMNERSDKVCVSCIMLEDQQNEKFELVDEDENSLQVVRKGDYSLNPKEAQLLNVIGVNVMAHYILEEDWNNQFVISKQTILRVLSQILFAFFIVAYDY